MSADKWPKVHQKVWHERAAVECDTFKGGWKCVVRLVVNGMPIEISAQGKDCLDTAEACIKSAKISLKFIRSLAKNPANHEG